MLDSLHFVKGAVGKKDLVPALTHFQIRDGRITGYNGKIALSGPIALDVDCVPKAVPLVKAIEACTDTAQLTLTPSGKLSIRSGKFRAHVDTLPDDVFPHIEPDGIVIPGGGHILQALKALYPITSEDASRPWAGAVLLDGQSAYATNNVIAAQYWMGTSFPYRVAVPRYCIKEVLRINEEPLQIQLTANNLTFHYEGGRWLRTQLVAPEWPDVAALLSTVGGRLPAAPDGLWDALATLAPFADEAARLYALGGRLATAAEEGCSVDVAGIPDTGLYNMKMLALLEGLATSIDFTAYPAPLPWAGDNVRGLFMGLRPSQGEQQ